MSAAELEAIHAETRRLNVADKIAFWDKRQGALERVDGAGNVVEPEVVTKEKPEGGTYIEHIWPEGSTFQRARTVILCPNDKAHGALGIVGGRSCVPGAIAGAVLICGERKGGAFCTGTVPV